MPNNLLIRAKPWLEIGGVILVGLAGSLLIFKNLDNYYLWQDEAHTALLAKTILRHGVPLGFDGKNYFSQAWGAEYGPHYLWRWHPWFPYYLLAAFFKVLGIGTWTARLPFALFGVATIPLLYFFTKRLWGNVRTAFLAAAFLTLSVPFLLLSRQCHYYAPLTFFMLLGFWSYRGVLSNDKRGRIFFVLSCLFIFHTLYTYYGVFLGTVVLHAGIFHRSYLRRVLRLSAMTLLLNLPGIVWFSRVRYGPGYSTNLLHATRAAHFMSGYVVRLGTYVFPPFLLLIGLLIFIKKRWAPSPRLKSVPDMEGLWMVVMFVVISIATYALLAPGLYFRFMAPTLPLLACAAAYIIDACADIHVALGGTAFVLAIAAQPLSNYFYELTHSFVGPVEGMVHYLNKFGEPEDVVAITYEDLPLKFYTDMRIVGGLTGEDLSPAKTARWVLLRKHTVSGMDVVTRDYIIKNVRPENYRAIPLPCPDTAFENREDPENHYYRTVLNESPVILFERKNTRKTAKPRLTVSPDQNVQGQ